jgi:hypothetical protein
MMKSLQFWDMNLVRENLKTAYDGSCRNLFLSYLNYSGHWKLGHTLSQFVITQLYFGASFYGFSLCYGAHAGHQLIRYYHSL